MCDGDHLVVCAEVSLYVYSYEDLEVYDGSKEGFCAFCSFACV